MDQWLDEIKDINPLILIVDRSEVEAGDLSRSIAFFSHFTNTPDTMRRWYEGVDIGFSGYDQLSEELDEINEVRQFVQRLDLFFPYWLFFMSKHYLGLQCVMHCMLPIYPKNEPPTIEFREAWKNLIETRWFPAMNKISRQVGLSQDEHRTLSDRVIDYCIKGPLFDD